MSSAPPFWWSKPGWQAWALFPFSMVYGLVASRRMARAPRKKIDVPVICIGNFTVGGTGKTPTTIALAKAAIRRGLKPGILSRGHGGTLRRAHIVNPKEDTAAIVGDEPLLLAQHATVAVSRKRLSGAELLLENGCDLILMDDGFQSAHLEIDHALLVVDARTGLGNAHVIPGGPLRAPLIEQLRYADSLLCIGSGTAADTVLRMAARAGKAIYTAATIAVEPDAFAGKKVLAFAGIGHPQRFFDALAHAGADVVQTRVFGDHHPFKPAELQELEREASSARLQLVTTEKDAARLRGSIVPEGFLQRLAVFGVETRFEPEDVPDRIIDAATVAFRKRRF
ncbi:MAG: tetraacyldisaccharide 4'-kinase [Rhizobiaceae bacterium]|nr:tetraacyldisaccharide 4'-kinase [Rhizobiaceae bacterium]